MNSRSDRTIAFFMVLPSLIIVGIFVYYFIGSAVQTSLTDWGENPAQPPLQEDVIKSYVGFQNYENLMTDMTRSNFRVSLVNTFFLTIFFVGGCIALGLFLAILLDQKIVGESFFRTVFLFPMSLSFVVTGTIWRWMLQPEGGINVLPTYIGLPKIDFAWISSDAVLWQFLWTDVPQYVTLLGIAILAFLAMRYVLTQRWRSLGFVGGAVAIVALIFFAGLWDVIWPPLDLAEIEPTIAPKGFNAALVGIIIAAIWQMAGYTMAMFIAGIRGIPEELREAARVDGCSEIGVYRHVILPQLNPIVLSAMIILGHISLKIFDLVFAMSGPDNDKTVVPGILVYTQGFRQNSFASASAIAIIMLCLVAVIIVPYLWTQLRTDS